MWWDNSSVLCCMGVCVYVAAHACIHAWWMPKIFLCPLYLLRENLCLNLTGLTTLTSSINLVSWFVLRTPCLCLQRTRNIVRLPRHPVCCCWLVCLCGCWRSELRFSWLCSKYFIHLSTPTDPLLKPLNDIPLCRHTRFHFLIYQLINT